MSWSEPSPCVIDELGPNELVASWVVVVESTTVRVVAGVKVVASGWTPPPHDTTAKRLIRSSAILMNFTASHSGALY